MNEGRLFLYNPYENIFEARVLSREKTARGYEVVLDRTAFYPTGGGQPNDTGWLDDSPVIDVVEENGTIVHILSQPIQVERVTGKIDWERRFDHMQQHLGQHILSSCFEKLADADTVGFHLGSQYVYIDLNRPDLPEETIYRAEDMANEIVFRSLAVKTYIVSWEDLPGIPLRKPPSVTEDIRIVEIDGFDFCPCGGTHPAGTGSVGIIKIRKWEKNKDGLRLEFVCGKRALRDFRDKNTSINKISSLLSVRDHEALGAVERIAAENKCLSKAVEELREQYYSLEAAAMVRDAREIGPYKIVRFMFYKKPFDEIKLLASKITEHGGCIALLCTSNVKAQLIISRSPDVPIDLRPVFKETMTLAGGKGGGSSAVVQGGVETPEKAQIVIDETIEALAKVLVGSS
ncbi:MAG: Alanyl-tRNA synthetase family protein [Firmicutes bacterium]|nr:Alanyl-tRNA synthetase family protein [Bacillota bacterium]